MSRLLRYILVIGLLLAVSPSPAAQGEYLVAQGSLFDIPPRWLVDMPTAGTLPRGHFDIGFRFYPNGGALTHTDIGLSSRIMLGISFGGEGVITAGDPDWNPRLEFSGKLRIIDEMEFFPAVTAGFSSQGLGEYNEDEERYAYKSRGFYGVVSRSFYFYNWTSGWHAGINHSLEDKDGDKDINIFGGFDATFKYNLALLVEFDAALNDNKSYDFAGKGRGYLNTSIKWLFTENLELELLFKDILVNRRESSTVTRVVRLTYIDRF